MTEKDDTTHEQQQRLWEHGMHEESVFNERLNYFLVFESVLLGAVGLLSIRANSDANILKTLAILGLAMTLVLWFVLARQRQILNVTKGRLREIFPEYRETVARRGRTISVTWLLAYLVPFVVATMWVGMLAVFSGWHIPLL